MKYYQLKDSDGNNAGIISIEGFKSINEEVLEKGYHEYYKEKQNTNLAVGFCEWLSTRGLGGVVKPVFLTELHT